MIGRNPKRRFNNFLNYPEIKAAMTATLLSLAERSMIELEKGEFNSLYIKGNKGYLLVLQAGLNAVLTVSTTKNARLGLIYLECKRIAEEIRRLMSNSDDFDDEGDDGYVMPFPFFPLILQVPQEVPKKCMMMKRGNN